jgi:predicted permease
MRDKPRSAGGRLPGHRQRVPSILDPERWLQDGRHGLRALRQARGYTITSVLTLVICLGGLAAVSAGVNTLLFNPLQTPQPERVVLMANQYPRVEAQRGTRSATPDYDDRLRHVTALDEQALYNFYAATITVGGLPTLTRGMVATPSLFRLLRVTPALGRIFTEEEGSTGNDTRVILTDGLWRELFGADPAVIGRTLSLSGRDFTIVGILPRDFSFVDPGARFWVPLALTDAQRSDEARHRNGWFSVGRLKPGATVAQVQAQLAGLDAANKELGPPEAQALLDNIGFFTGVEPLRDALVRDVRRPLLLLWGAAFGVLIIGVANLANIAMARSRARLNELGTRLAIGGAKVDVARQLLVEGLLIGLAGAAGALPLGAWILSLLRTRALGWSRLHLDPTVTGITVGLAVLAGMLIGLVSATPLFTMRIGTMLHEGARGGTAARAARTARHIVVVGQMAGCFILIMGAALLWVSLRNLLAVDPGFRTADVLTAMVSVPSPRYRAADEVRGFVNRSLESFRRLPGVSAAGGTTVVPLSGAMESGVIVAERYVSRPGEPSVGAIRSYATPGYFEAIGTPLVRGRYFDDRDDRPEARTVVIDERLARRFWPDGDAIGQRLFHPSRAGEFAIDATTPWMTVIGVVRSARLSGSLGDDGPSGTSGTYYLPYATAAVRNLGFVIRMKAEAIDAVNEVRAALARIDPEIPLSDVRTMSERTDQSLLARTNAMQLAMLLAAVAVFLSAIGLYGTLSYLVAQRRREIGVRLAVGSSPRAIVTLIFREGFLLAFAGMVIGAVASVLAGRLLGSQLYGITASDPLVMLLTIVTLSAVAALACLIPARRAASVDVIRALSAP